MSSMLRLPTSTAGKNGGGGDNRWWQLCIAGNAIERREKEAFHLPASVTQLKLRTAAIKGDGDTTKCVSGGSLKPNDGPLERELRKW